MEAREFFAFLVSLIVSLGVIATIVALGWFCVWKFFLLRFRLVRELLGTVNDNDKTGPVSDDVSAQANGRRESSRKGQTGNSSGAYKSTRSRSRKED